MASLSLIEIRVPEGDAGNYRHIRAEWFKTYADARQYRVVTDDRPTRYYQTAGEAVQSALSQARRDFRAWAGSL